LKLFTVFQSQKRLLLIPAITPHKSGRCRPAAANTHTEPHETSTASFRFQKELSPFCKHCVKAAIAGVELRYKDRKKLNFFKKSDKVLFCVPFAPIAKWRREPIRSAREPTNFHAYAGRYTEMRENATSPMKK
jgi:hypothetical protein